MTAAWKVFFCLRGTRHRHLGPQNCGRGLNWETGLQGTAEIEGQDNDNACSNIISSYTRRMVVTTLIQVRQFMACWGILTLRFLEA